MADGPDKDKLTAIFKELEFRTLAQRVLGEAPASSKPSADVQLSMFAAASDDKEEDQVKKDTIETKEHQYHLVEEDQVDSLVEYLLLQDEVCFDTETTSINAVDAELVGMSFSYQPGEAYYVPFPPEKDKIIALLAPFKPFFESDKILKIGQNIKYDMLVLKKYGCEVEGPLFDTMLAHYLIDPDSRHGMDILAEQYLNYIPVSIKELES